MEVQGDSAMADEFNSYFSNVAVNLRNYIPQVDLSPLHCINCNMPNSLFLFPDTVSECDFDH